MLEDSPASIFAAVCAWFSPAVLFLLLNIVIGTIAVASKSSHHQPAAADDAAAAHPGRSLVRSLSRSPSIFFDHVRSFSRDRFFHGEIPDPVGAGTGLADEEPPTVPEEEAEAEKEGEEEYHQPLGRSQSDTHPTAGEMPPKLAVRVKKSASEKSAFAHFKEEDVEEAAREAVDPPAERDGGEEVDARADDFINRFRRQLKLQRLESILRYKEMINRGS